MINVLLVVKSIFAQEVIVDCRQTVRRRRKRERERERKKKLGVDFLRSVEKTMSHFLSLDSFDVSNGSFLLLLFLLFFRILVIFTYVFVSGIFFFFLSSLVLDNCHIHIYTLRKENIFFSLSPPTHRRRSCNARTKNKCRLEIYDDKLQLKSAKKN